MFQTKELINDDCNDEDYEYKKNEINYIREKRNELIKSLLHNKLGEFALLVQQYLKIDIDYNPKRKFIYICISVASSMIFDVSCVASAVIVLGIFKGSY